MTISYTNADKFQRLPFKIKIKTVLTDSLKNCVTVLTSVEESQNSSGSRRGRRSIFAPFLRYYHLFPKI